MKFLNVVNCAVQIELDATDCLQLADALHYSENRDMPGNRIHIAALQSALTACAILAAVDTNQDADTPVNEWAAKTRKVWGPRDSRWLGNESVIAPPD